jgi:hypothetical protein
LVERFELCTIEGEDNDLVVNVNEAAHSVALLPPWQLTLALTAGIEPHELPAPIIGLAKLIISNSIPLMVEKL